MAESGDASGRRSRTLRAGLTLTSAFWLTALGMTISKEARAETLKGAAAHAVATNPAFAARRSAFLATREKLPQALAGYLPQATATADIGYLNQSGEIGSLGVSYPNYDTMPRGAGVQISQTLFDGFRTQNTVSQAHAQIAGANSALDDAEQGTVLAAAVAYIDVLRDRALLALAKQNLAFLEGQARLVGERHKFGDVTLTDVSQARSRVAGARVKLSAAEASVQASLALYRATVGSEPDNLAPAGPADTLVPPGLDADLRLAMNSHPALLAAQKGVEAAESGVKIADADFLPTAKVGAFAGQRYDVATRGDGQLSGSVIGQLSIPLYDGGMSSSKGREARQIASQRQFELDSLRDQIHSSVQVAWSRLAASRAQVASAEIQSRSAETTLSSMMQEYMLGQRDTTSILDAVQDCQNACQRNLRMSPFPAT